MYKKKKQSDLNSTGADEWRPPHLISTILSHNYIYHKCSLPEIVGLGVFVCSARLSLTYLALQPFYSNSLGNFSLPLVALGFNSANM